MFMFGKYIYQNSRPRIIHPLVAAAVGLTVLPSVRTLQSVFAAITQLQRNQTDVKAVQICFQFAIKFLYRVFFFGLDDCFIVIEARVWCK